MSTESEERSGYGIGGAYGWPIGGVLGGLVGTAAFGLLLWVTDPEVLETTIPGLYGLDPGGLTGWLIHLAHGAVLGLLFGFIVTRDAVLGALLADVETPALSGSSDTLRFVGAGLAYGLAVWTILPLLALAAPTGVAQPGALGEFPSFALESMIGHALFGIILGAVFAAVVDVYAPSRRSTLEE